MKYIHVKNWDRYQHPDTKRGERAMPWIKSYTQQLSELEYLELSYADRGLLEAIRLQYALNRALGLRWFGGSLTLLLGKTPRVGQIERLSDAGFIVISACETLAEGLQVAGLDKDRDKDKDREPSDTLARVGESADADIIIESATTAGQDFVAFFVQEVRRTTGRDPLVQAKARVGRDALVLLRQGVAPDVIRSAIVEVVKAGLMVGALQSVADQIQRGGFKGHGKDRGPSAAEIAQWADELEEETGL